MCVCVCVFVCVWGGWVCHLNNATVGTTANEEEDTCMSMRRRIHACHLNNATVGTTAYHIQQLEIVYTHPALAHSEDLMCVCVCACVCVCVCIHVHVYIYTYMCIYNTYTHVYVCVYI